MATTHASSCAPLRAHHVAAAAARRPVLPILSSSRWSSSSSSSSSSRSGSSSTSSTSTSSSSSTTTTSSSRCPQQQAALAAVTASLGASLLLLSPGAACAKAAPLDLRSCEPTTQAGALRFCDVAPGKGEPPGRGDLVVVDYTARAVSTGKVFDGSRSFKFTLGEEEGMAPAVTPGFVEGMLGNGDGLPPIRPGGTRTLLIPPELAFGAGAGGGDGCLFGRAANCRLPPDSPVELTFTYRGLGY